MDNDNQPVDNKYLSDIVTSAQIPLFLKRHHTDKKEVFGEKKINGA